MRVIGLNVEYFVSVEDMTGKEFIKSLLLVDSF